MEASTNSNKKSLNFFLRRPYGKAISINLSSSIQFSQFLNIVQQAGQQKFKVDKEYQLLILNGKILSQTVLAKVSTRKIPISQQSIIHLIDRSKVQNLKIKKISINLNRFDQFHLLKVQEKVKQTHAKPNIQNIQVPYDMKIGHLLRQIIQTAGLTDKDLFLSYVGRILILQNTFRQQMVQNSAQIYVIHRGMKKCVKRQQKRRKQRQQKNQDRSQNMAMESSIVESSKKQIAGNNQFQVQVSAPVICQQNSYIYNEDGSEQGLTNSNSKPYSFIKTIDPLRNNKKLSEKQAECNLSEELSYDSKSTCKHNKQIPSTNNSNSDNTINNIDPPSFITKNDKFIKHQQQKSINSGYKNENNSCQFSPQNFSHSQNHQSEKWKKSLNKNPPKKLISILQNDISIVSQRKSEMSQSKSQFENFGSQYSKKTEVKIIDKDSNANQKQILQKSYQNMLLSKQLSSNKNTDKQEFFCDSSNQSIKIQSQLQKSKQSNRSKSIVNQQTNKNLPQLHLEQTFSYHSYNLNMQPLRIISQTEKYEIMTINSQRSYKSVKKGDIQMYESEIVSYIQSVAGSQLQETVIVKEITEDNYDFDPFQESSPMKKSKGIQLKNRGLSFLKMKDSQISPSDLNIQNQANFGKKKLKENNEITQQDSLDFELKCAIEQNNWNKQQIARSNPGEMKTSLKIPFKKANLKLTQPGLKQTKIEKVTQKSASGSGTIINSDDLQEFCAQIDKYQLSQKIKTQKQQIQKLIIKEISVQKEAESPAASFRQERLSQKSKSIRSSPQKQQEFFNQSPVIWRTNKQYQVKQHDSQKYKAQENRSYDKTQSNNWSPRRISVEVAIQADDFTPDNYLRKLNSQKQLNNQQVPQKLYAKSQLYTQKTTNYKQNNSNFVENYETLRVQEGQSSNQLTAELSKRQTNNTYSQAKEVFQNMQGNSIIEDFSVFFENIKQCLSDQHGFFEQSLDKLQLKKNKDQNIQQINSVKLQLWQKSRFRQSFSPKRDNSLINSAYSIGRQSIKQFRKKQQTQVVQLSIEQSG